MPSEYWKTPGTSQAAEVRGKAPMASAPPSIPMNQSPQYTTTTTARSYTGNSQAPTFQMPNASADSLLMQQRFMTQPEKKVLPGSTHRVAEANSLCRSLVLSCRWCRQWELTERLLDRLCLLAEASHWTPVTSASSPMSLRMSLYHRIWPRWMLLRGTVWDECHPGPAAYLVPHSLFLVAP
jgi:hypothetical protein